MTPPCRLEVGWAEAESRLTPLAAHLQSLDSDTVRSFLQAADPKFQQYGLHYDLSCGHPHKVSGVFLLPLPP